MGFCLEQEEGVDEGCAVSGGCGRSLVVRVAWLAVEGVSVLRRRPWVSPLSVYAHPPTLGLVHTVSVFVCVCVCWMVWWRGLAKVV